MTPTTEALRPSPATRSQDDITLAIGGMTCGSCARVVQNALSAVPGVESVAIDLRAAQASVRGAAQPDALLAAVRAAGYHSSLQPDAMPGDRPRTGGCGCGC